MMSDLSEGSVDRVIVYNLDRLIRQPVELKVFADTVARAGVTQVRFVAGDMGIGTDDGLLMARITGAFAAEEAATISRRVLRKMDQVAAEGRPHGGSRRPFGYAADKITVVAEEAEVYRHLVARFLAGESTPSLASWLNESEVSTVTGVEWRTTTIKGILTSPRYAGLRTHRGEVVGPAVWEAIITGDDHRRILAKYAENKGTGRRTPQRYLLSGMVRCTKCGTRLYSAARTTNGKATRRHVCLSGPDHGGCGSIAITADPLERLVADAVLYRLDTPDLADTLADRTSADARTQGLTMVLDQSTEQLEGLALLYAASRIGVNEWTTAREPVTARQESTRAQLAG